MDNAKTIKEVVEQFPEPFRSVIRSGYVFSIDYRSDADHKYLEEHGYTIQMGGDCANYVKELKYLNATSYGNWGSLYSGTGMHDDVENYMKCLDVFSNMFKNGIVMLWRVRVYIDKVAYDYDDDTKRWTKYDSEKKEWVECENPLPEEDDEINCDKLF